jgi:epoxyqueuosine reductase
LETFIERGYHGDMGWLETHAERRKSPRSLWPEVETVIVLGANYGPDHLPHERLDKLKENSQANISVYARNRDYHDVMKKRLKRVGRWMSETFDCDVKVFVDTAPVLEKPIAQQAGIGWQGKHTNVVSQEFGSWLFLSEIYTTLKLPPDTSEPDRCGTCHKCLDICPTNAFTSPYQLDARKCISYLTIEHKGHIGPEFRTAMGTRIYGCDDCLSVCPWNKFARTTIEPEFLPRDSLEGPAISTLLRLDDAEFRRMFSKSPVKRTGRDRLIRNTLIAAGNTGDRSLADDVTPLLDDPSPLIRAMAVWALAQLTDVSEFNFLRERYQSGEPDKDVLEEWRTAAV